MDNWKLFAIRLNDFRVVPRLIVGGYSVMLYQVTIWFMTLDVPNLEQAGMLGVVYGIAGMICKFYISSGNIDEDGKEW